MIRRSVGLLVAILFAFSIMAFALAREGPTKQKAFTPVIAVKTVTPTVANVAPVMTGYDVIQNLTTESRVLANSESYGAVTTDRGSRSTTGDERGLTRSGYDFDRSAPCFVMLA